MFFQKKSYQRLQGKKAVDLTESLALERMQKMTLKGVGFELFYGMERVSEEILSDLYALAQEMAVLEKMKAMQSGDKINRIEGFASENRSVLHTAMRDQFSDPQTAPAAKEAAAQAAKELNKLKHFLSAIEGRFTDFVQIGIGGSDLGPKALALALSPFRKASRQVHFISNVDPDDAARVLEGLDLKKTAFVIVSKSGTTLETLTNEACVRERLAQAGLDAKEHCIAVTGENSPMDDTSRYLASFFIWDFVGGRYSATSMVGAVSLGFYIGFEKFLEILQGAHAMDVHALGSPVSKNLPLVSALLGLWNRNVLHLPTVAIIPYSQALSRFPAHLQQLDMESNGKRIDKEGKPLPFSSGPIIWGEPGTNGQHSFYQWIHQGTDIVPIEFIGFKKSQSPQDLLVFETTSQEKLLANLFAQSIALAVGQKNDNPNRQFLGNRPNRILLAERLDPFTLGALLSYYEHKVAFQGFLWDINSFDQEGVQLGKTLANKILAQFRAKRTGEKVESFPLADFFIYKITQ